MKVYELAKQLNIPNKELIEKINAIGIDVSSHLNILEDEQVEIIIENMGTNDMPDKFDILEENKILQERLAKLEQQLNSDADDEIKEIPLNRTVKVMSLFSGGLNLKTSNDSNATVFRFSFIGETFPIIYADLIKIIANQRRFFKEGYCMILDRDVVKAHYLEDDYKKFIDAKVINNILKYDISKIKEIFINTTPVIQRSIVDVIIKEINENKFIDMSKISAVSEMYGQNIFELANKMK